MVQAKVKAVKVCSYSIVLRAEENNECNLMLHGDVWLRLYHWCSLRLN